MCPCYSFLMPQTHEGAMKVLAAKAGVSLNGYLLKVRSGLKWCYYCKDWHPVECFGVDTSRYDGLAPLCAGARKDRYRKSYKPVPVELRKKMGPPAKPSRDGDKIQARQRINVLVRTGRMAHPNTLPCKDCGHVWEKGERRHEYDHPQGYLAQNHYVVDPVCTKCHAAREKIRGTNYVGRARSSSGKFTGR